MARADWRLVYGDGADMALVGDGEAALVLTSPPYFSDETEALLRAPLRQQTELELVRAQVVAYALTLRPVFAEAFRVLRPGGKLVVQTKDLRYGGHLVTLAGIHRELAESVGFRLTTRVFWRAKFDSPRHATEAKALARARSVGGFRAYDVEEFLVLSCPGAGPGPDRPTELADDVLRGTLGPLWELPGAPRPTHPYQSPPAVVRRFIALCSSPGDLVVDPFAGHGTTLRAACSMGRRSIGYELDRACAEFAQRLLERRLGPQR